MTVLANGNTADLGGNIVVASAIALGADTPGQTNAALPAIYVGAGSPSFSASKGSLYLNTTGSSASTRMFVNNGTTTWVAVTTAS